MNTILLIIAFVAALLILRTLIPIMLLLLLGIAFGIIKIVGNLFRKKPSN